MPGKIDLNDLKAYSLKAFFRPLDLIGDRFIFNRDPPTVLEIVGNIHYGPHKHQRLDIIRPDDTPPWPVLIYFHGGGWVVGSKESYMRVCRQLACNGYLTVNVNYRLAPRFRCEAQVHDVARAIEWVYSRAAHYGGDPTRIVLAGDSAGAFHASWYASGLQDDRLFDALGIETAIPPQAIEALVLFYGVYDFDSVLMTSFPFIKVYAKSFLSSEPGLYERWAEVLSPVRHIGTSLPPVFLCAGEEDSLFPQTVEYARALERARIPHKAVFLAKDRYRDAGHGFLYFYDRECTRFAMKEVRRFLSDVSR